MRKFITKSLEMLSLVFMALMVIAMAFGGGNTGGFTGFIIGAVTGAVMAIVIFGALFVLMDIADNTRRTAELLERQNPG